MSHTEKIWWLEENELGGMPKPPIESIPDLKKEGLGAVASFLEGKDNLEEYERNGLKCFWSAIEDDEAPSLNQVKDFVKFVDEMKSEGLALAVHCKGGNGRAGTMLAAYYISKGQGVQEVLSFMRKINPRAVATKTQEDFLNSL
ncbi:dual specificity protein phosphatase family protein [Lentisphaera profundi]|uniref:Dual specificity protein phosphatase family protein n=1 Tax=Lentisphaera profundi TaxID=1658616 RepID=A0ABY7VTH1_9BACT|nr:dual specificity protein phosphatase family protein [Lentisphaera profundi]WDE97488.1 dual specificity protein phosphatase family protein [Lentisphaera profundi]